MFHGFSICNKFKKLLIKILYSIILPECHHCPVCHYVVKMFVSWKLRVLVSPDLIGNVSYRNTTTVVHIYPQNLHLISQIPLFYLTLF